MTGYYSHTVAFNPPQNDIIHTAVGGVDAYVIKYGSVPLGQPPVTEERAVSLYPNPAIGTSFLHFNESAFSGTITISDMQGRETRTVQVKQVHDFEIDLNGSPGIYFVRVYDGTREQRFKIINDR